MQYCICYMQDFSRKLCEIMICLKLMNHSKVINSRNGQAAAYKNNKTGKYVSPSDITDLSNPKDPIDNSN